MDALVQQILALAAEVPAEVEHTAKTLRFVATGLQARAETRRSAAEQLRILVAANRDTAQRLHALPITASLFSYAADVLERAADLLDPRPREEATP